MDRVGRSLRWLRDNAWRVLVGIVGFSVLILGIIAIVTPGPALILIPAGLAILATQFDWAQRALDEVRARIDRMRGRDEDSDRERRSGRERGDGSSATG